MKTQLPTFTLLRYICSDNVRDKSVCSSSEHVACKAQSETNRFHQTLFLHKPCHNALDCGQYACTKTIVVQVNSCKNLAAVKMHTA